MAWGLVAAAAITTVGGAIISDGANDAAESASNSASEYNKLQGEIAKEAWDRYKQIYLPFEQQFLEESKGVGSIANQNKAAQRAAADVASQFAGARERLGNNPGLDPGSDTAVREKNKINLAEAAASAAAQNAARENTRDKGRAATIDALSLGKGLPANATTGLANAAGGLQSAANYSQRRADSQAEGFGRMVGGITSSRAFQNWVGGGAPAVTPLVANGAVNPVSGEYYGSLEF